MSRSASSPLGDDEVMDYLKGRLEVRSPNALQHVVLDAVADGTIAPGSRLPTVRALAEAVGMSRSAVAQAWADLAARSVVQTRRRGGTIVVGLPQAPRAERFETMVARSRHVAVDLANLRGDTLPRPDLRPAVQWAVEQPLLNHVFAEPIVPDLEAVVRRQWDWSPQTFLATHGMPDAIELFLATTVRRGDRVIIEAPTYPRVLDNLEAVGAHPIPLPWHGEGPSIPGLRAALADAPAAMIYQPSCAVPTGRSVTAGWVAEAAEVLRDSAFPILECSIAPHLDPAASSLGTRLPDRVAQNRAFNFALGQDIKVGALGGPAAIVEPMWLKLSFSSRGVSRLLQLMTAYLLSDPEALGELEAMRVEGRRRRHSFAQALTRRGLPVATDDPGPSLWVPVPEEESVIAALLQQQIITYPGANCVPVGGRLTQVADLGPHLHLGGMSLQDEHDEIAAVIAQACGLSVDISR